ncbi:MAG: hypothetical protein M3N52_06035 [Actinomycetota bacterium]|nr:hypothetical protein [Actinomycetota bacterium]
MTRGDLSMVELERCSDEARRVLACAQDEARTLRHSAIGTEHVLLALMQAKGSLALQVLESLGLTEPAVRRRVEAVVGRGGQATFGRIPLDERLHKVWELAEREARVSAREQVGPEHLLFAVLREGQNVGAKVLKELGVDSFALRRQLRELAGEPSAADGHGGLRQGTVFSLLAGRSGPGEDSSTPGGWEVLDRLSERAWAALLQARQQALRLGHDGVDAEHLLVGALGATDGMASAALTAAGGSHERLAVRLESMLGRGGEAKAGYLPFTPLSKLVLGLAGLEARRRSHDAVTTGHVLAALLQAHAPATEGLLRRVGADPQGFRAELDRRLSESPDGRPMERAGS